ncbi:hypothetical protein sphantq_04299 [Sphingobium sp. AntQ-1]|nr:hypothetical protein sphantq_04299 [Sphingobium sp. AntQ-1]
MGFILARFLCAIPWVGPRPPFYPVLHHSLDAKRACRRSGSFGARRKTGSHYGLFDRFSTVVRIIPELAKRISVDCSARASVDLSSPARIAGIKGRRCAAPPNRGMKVRCQASLSAVLAAACRRQVGLSTSCRPACLSAARGDWDPYPPPFLCFPELPLVRHVLGLLRIGRCHEKAPRVGWNIMARYQHSILVPLAVRPERASAL